MEKKPIGCIIQARMGSSRFPGKPMAKINGIPMFLQGQRPYCAISTLGMATHYLGLRLGTDALAAGAKFRYIDTAKGSKMLDLYRAAAEESDAVLQRGRSFDFERAQKYIRTRN